MSPDGLAGIVRDSPALSVGKVSHRYDTEPVVSDVSFDVGRGEVCCLVGPSGCGKTTLLRLAAGLEPLQQGAIAVDGGVVASVAISMPPERRGVGMVFQDFALFPHMTARRNIAFGLRDRPDATDRVARALALVGMADQADSYPHMLSGGQQQRVALARALAPDPAVLLLDEPFSGLDARLRDRVRDETLHTIKQSNAAALLVTHDPEEAMFMADRIVLLEQGRVRQDGTPTEIYFAPRTPFVANFFSDTNLIKATVRSGTVDTVFGPLPAPGLADGAAAVVLVRPEALGIHLRAHLPHMVGARVAAARLLGRTCLVHLEVEDTRFGRHHLHSRAPGRVLPAEGTRVSISLDRSQAFVFPDSD